MEYFDYQELFKDDFYIGFEKYVKNTLNLPVDYKKNYIGFGNFYSFNMFWIKKNQHGEFEINCRKKFLKSSNDNILSIEFKLENEIEIRNAVNSIYNDYLLKNKNPFVEKSITDIVVSEDCLCLVSKLEESLKILKNYLDNNCIPIYFCDYVNYMSRRLFNTLNRAKITNFKDLSNMSATMIYRINNLGQKSLLELIDIINFINSGKIEKIKSEQNLNRSNCLEFENKENSDLHSLVKNKVNLLRHSEISIVNLINGLDRINKSSEDQIERFQCISIEILEYFKEACNIILQEPLSNVYNMISSKQEEQTLQSIGNLLNLSRERIRQILVKIPKRLRVYIRNGKIFQFIKIIEMLNGFTLEEFLSFLFYGIHMKSSNKMTECFINTFYSITTTKQLMNLFQKTLEVKEKSIKNLDLISSNVVYVNNIGDNKPNIQNIGSIDSNFSYKYLVGVYEILKDLPEVKRIICNPDIVYYRSSITTHRPDFAIELNNGNIVLMLVLPTINLGYVYNLKRFNQLHLYCKENNFGYIIIDDRCRSIQFLKNLPISVEVEKYLDNILKRKKNIVWEDIKSVKYKYHITNDIIVSYVLKNKLNFTMNPFIIKK